MKTFTLADLDPGKFAGIITDKSDLFVSELPWQKLGLQQTSSGYGAKLTTRYKINFEGKLRRVYATCYSNAASHWFSFKGQTIYVSLI